MAFGSNGAPKLLARNRFRLETRLPLVDSSLGSEKNSPTLFWLFSRGLAAGEGVPLCTLPACINTASETSGGGWIEMGRLPAGNRPGSAVLMEGEWGSPSRRRD